MSDLLLSSATTLASTYGEDSPSDRTSTVVETVTTFIKPNLPRSQTSQNQTWEKLNTKKKPENCTERSQLSRNYREAILNGQKLEIWLKFRDKEKIDQFWISFVIVIICTYWQQKKSDQCGLKKYKTKFGKKFRRTKICLVRNFFSVLAWKLTFATRILAFQNIDLWNTFIASFSSKNPRKNLFLEKVFKGWKLSTKVSWRNWYE